jgi:DNA-binding transcriptional ArsR family regulator
MSAVPPWGDAKPLPGCDVIRTAAGPSTPPRRPKPKKRPSGVVRKLLVANRFLDRSARQLPPAAALVWVLLWRDERDGTARTAVSDLARRSGLSARTVKRHLRTLKARGLVRVVQAGSVSRGPTVYRLRTTGSRPSG